MDSHIKGPRGGNAHGAVASQIVAGAKFGDTAQALVEIFRTDGATTGLGKIPSMPGAGKKYPILIEIFANIITAFDGTGPVFRLTETNLDDSGAAVIANISDYTGGRFTVQKFLTVDKKYKLTYTPATGAPTTGEGYISIKATGPGNQQV